jgi:hypothetical protein
MPIYELITRFILDPAQLPASADNIHNSLNSVAIAANSAKLSVAAITAEANAFANTNPAVAAALNTYSQGANQADEALTRLQAKVQNLQPPANFSAPSLIPTSTAPASVLSLDSINPALQRATTHAAALAAQAHESTAALSTTIAPAESLREALGEVVDTSHTLPPNFRSASSAAQTLGSTGTAAANSLTGALGTVLTRLTAIAGTYFGLQALTRTLGSSISQAIAYEDRVSNFAALINANFQLDPNRNFAASVEQADFFLNALAQRAASLPGTFSEFTEAAQSLAGPIFAAGEGLQQLLDRTERVPILAQLLQSSSADVGDQLSRMLLGRAESRSPLTSYLIGLQLINADVEKLNAMAPKERLEEIFGAIDKVASDPDLLARIANSSSTAISTLYDNVFGVTGFMGIIGTTLREAINPEAARLNAWFDSNQSSLKSAATSVTDLLLPALNATGRTLTWMADNAASLTTHLRNAAIAFAAFKVGTVAIPTITAATAATGTILRSAVLAGGIAAAGGTGAPAIITAISTGIATLFAGGGAALTAKLAALIAPIGSLLPPVIVGLALIAVAVAAVQGSLAVFRDDTRWASGFFRTSLQYLSDSAGRFGTAFNNLLTPLMGEGSTLLGSIILPALGLLATGLGAVLDAIALLVNTIGASMASIGAGLAAIWEHDFRNIGTLMADAYTHHLSTRTPTPPPAPANNTNPTANLTDVRPTPSNIQIQNLNVTNNFTRETSPDRVAFGIIEELQKIRSRTPVLKPMQGY